MRRDDLTALSDAVRTAVWEDDKETYTSSSLVGPPVLEFSIYKKVPSGKKRTDSRQGTIDQDPEFMAFLEGLANPEVQKDVSEEPPSDDGSTAESKVTTTPLIEYLKKKALKAKETAAAKSAKHVRQESQGDKGKASSSKSEEPKKKSKESRGGKSDTPRETVKILTKKQAVESAAEAARTVAAQLSSMTAKEPARNRRAGIAAAARILQRDLGLSVGNAHRKARQDVQKAEAEAKDSTATTGTATKEEAPSGSSTGAAAETARTAPGASSTPAPQDQANTPTGLKSQAASSSRRSRARRHGHGNENGDAKSGGEKSADKPASPTTKAPTVLLKKKDEGQQSSQSRTQSASTVAGAPGASSATPTPPNVPKSASGKAVQDSGSHKKGSTAPTPTPGATRAFIKHANPSQGVTELLLKEAMQVFGAVTFVEIDRRKGFAFVDFADADGLAKAMAASPVSVAQAAVQVLERKEVAASKKVAASSAASSAGKAAAPADGGTAPATPTGPAADKEAAAGGSKDKAEKEKRHRRRGGRGRGGDGSAKEGASGPSSSGSKSAEAGGSHAPAALSTNGG